MKIFFDVDGVLIHGWQSNPELRRQWDETIEQDLGIDRTAFQEKFFATPASGAKSLMHACVKGDLDLKSALAEVLPHLGYAGAIDQFVDYWFTKDSTFNDQVLNAVKRLGRHSHVELFIATEQEHYRAAYLWNDLKLKTYFKDIFYSARLRQLKNTTEFFAVINNSLGIKPSEAPLIFDDQQTIVDIACELGWDACVFDSAEDVLNHPRLRDLLV